MLPHHPLLLHIVGSLPSGVTEMLFILPQCWRASNYLVLLQKQLPGNLSRSHQTVAADTG